MDTRDCIGDITTFMDVNTSHHICLQYDGYILVVSHAFSNPYTTHIEISLNIIYLIDAIMEWGLFFIFSIAQPYKLSLLHL